LTVVPGSEGQVTGGARAIALRQDPTRVLLTDGRGTLWRSTDSGVSWSAPTAMFDSAPGALEGGGVMLQLSAAHKTHPNRIVAAYDQPIGLNKSHPCGPSPYAATCEHASSYWSDDMGNTWSLSKGYVQSMDESELLERADGSIAMMSRNPLNPNPNCAGVDLSQCATHQDGGCMCVGQTISSDGGESWQQTEFLPSLWGANCRGSTLQLNGSSYYAMPAYRGPARMPNPVHPSCKWKGHCYTDRAPNRINGTVFKAGNVALTDWQVHERVTIGAADGGHQTYAAFGYSSLAPLPPKIWPRSIGLIYETGAPDCGYDPQQNTATGMGSSTSACKIVFAVVDVVV
jgi:hypothetical protein